MQKKELVTIEQPEWMLDLKKVSGNLLDTLESLNSESTQEQIDIANAKANIASKIVDVARVQIAQADTCIKLYELANKQ